MWRSLAGSALALVLLGIFAPVNGQGTSPSPQSGKPPDPELRGQWLRVGQTFACKVEAGKRITPPDPDALSFACQRMGALGVGISEASLKAALGEPHRKLPPANNATNYVYFLGKPDQLPYLAATVKANRVVALQVSGPAPVAAYGFNQVNLGDSIEKLIARFGGPFHVGPSGLEKTELWTYEPWPFSFEVRQDRVTSIRISDPTIK
ncbi:hypothetical protein M2189_006064 [Bradyrhizobium japonicum]|uniref:hypothetical protein n=1 Tax=Bradyrhizobium japonicum TaxID=375 RepID=UPI0021699143|nr:hypothetical protein [Bradyrhizobium japonicum]MCS3494976.1 hypothetical protein [Bradyrhizobium japonicum]MCS3962861.1 hypothetical protein [Bradyrhizobium japonicum]MCS3995177.1 hypothetical protein [Bradyrhizobium japonicum]